MRERRMLAKALAVAALGVAALVTTPSSTSAATPPPSGCEKCLNGCPGGNGSDGSELCAFTYSCGYYGGICYDDGCDGVGGGHYQSTLYCYGAE
jgi:hypothetical protein